MVAGGFYDGGQFFDMPFRPKEDYKPDLNTYDDVGDVMMPQTPIGKRDAMQGLIDDMNPLTKGINNIVWVFLVILKMHKEI